MSVQTLLLTTVGVSDYSETRFVFDNNETVAFFSPVAFADLLDIDAALIAHTTQVEAETDHLKMLQDGFDELDTQSSCIRVPLIHGRDEINLVLDRLATAISEIDPDSIVLDTSHAYRTLQLTFYTSVMQLAALDLIDIKGIYYAENAGGGGTAQVIDLTYLATLVEWYHALRSFSTAGTLFPVREMLESKRNRVYRRGDEDPELVRLESAISGVSDYFDSGLPLEAGVAARTAVETLESLDDGDFIGPEGTFLDPLEDKLSAFVVGQAVASQGKVALELTMTELQRQRDVVRFYAEHGKYWIALECARELFINRVLYETEMADDWLDTETRLDTKELLTGRAGKRAGDSETPEAVRVWDQLSQYRNMHAHAGFDENQTPTGDSVTEPIEVVCDRVTDDTFWQPVV